MEGNIQKENRKRSFRTLDSFLSHGKKIKPTPAESCSEDHHAPAQIVEKNKHITQPQPSTSRADQKKIDQPYISINISMGPKQPELNFPRRTIGGKLRSFQSHWYSKYFWLEYSEKKDSVFCFTCRHFSSQKSSDTFVNCGYDDWKNLGNMIKKHEISTAHKFSASKYNGWKCSQKTGTVSSKISDQLTKEIEKNRETLKSIIRCALFCARQNIGLRAHREVKQEKEKNTYEAEDGILDDSDAQDESQDEDENQKTAVKKSNNRISRCDNTGNFKELVHLLSLENENLNENIQNMPKNAKYTSNTVQNEILTIASDIISRKITEEIKRGSHVFGLIVDEARDEGCKEQMSLSCRYLDSSGIKERFLGFVELKHLDAQSLANTIKEFLDRIGLDLQYCVSQSFDGASVMSGKFNGVQAKIRQMANNPCPYVHCHAHRINLVLVDVSKNVQEVHDVIGILEAVYAFQSSSTLRHSVFSYEVETKSGTKHLKVPQHGDTRWVSKYKSVHFFKTQFGSIVKSLQTCANSQKSKEAAEARGLLLQLTNFEVIFVLVALDEILTLVNILSLQLQSPVLDVVKCSRIIEATTENLEKFRNDEKFEELYKESQDIFQNCVVNGPSKRSQRTQASCSRLKDYFILETTGKGKTPLSTEIDAEKTRFRTALFSIVDNMLCEMQRRFSDNASLLPCIAACDPESVTFLSAETLCSFAKLHDKDEDFLAALKSQCNLGRSLFINCKDAIDLYRDVVGFGSSFKELKAVISLLLVIPVSSALAERSFSTMRRLKTYLRSTMTGQKLHSLGLLCIEKEESYKLLCNPDIVVDEFAALKGRRMKFLLK